MALGRRMLPPKFVFRPVLVFTCQLSFLEALSDFLIHLHLAQKPCAGSHQCLHPFGTGAIGCYCDQIAASSRLP